MTEDENNGYGYVVDGKIDLRTVGPTEVSAMVNALVIHLGYTPKATDTTGISGWRSTHLLHEGGPLRRSACSSSRSSARSAVSSRQITRRKSALSVTHTRITCND
jgi:hypothetical protein